MVAFKQSSRIICALALTSALVALIAAFQSEAAPGFIRKALNKKTQAKVNQMGDVAIQSVKSTMAKSDLKRILLVEKAVEIRCSPAYEREIQFVVPRDEILTSFVRVMRLELKAYYLGRITIDQQQFEQTFNEKFLTPCRQFDEHLNRWWQVASEGIYPWGGKSFDMLVAENICRILIETVSNDASFIESARKELDNSIGKDVVEMSKVRYESRDLQSVIETVLQSVQPNQLDQLLFLRNCITFATGFSDDPIDTVDLARGLVTFMILDEQLEGNQAKHNLGLIIHEKFVKPCEKIELSSVREIDFRLHNIADICKTFKKLYKNGELSDLIEEIRAQIPKQIEHSPMISNERSEERFLTIFS